MQIYVIYIVFGYRTAESYCKTNNDVNALSQNFIKLIIAIYIIYLMVSVWIISFNDTSVKDSINRNTIILKTKIFFWDVILIFKKNIWKKFIWQVSGKLKSNIYYVKIFTKRDSNFSVKISDLNCNHVIIYWSCESTDIKTQAWKNLWRPGFEKNF